MLLVELPRRRGVKIGDANNVRGVFPRVKAVCTETAEQCKKLRMATWGPTGRPRISSGILAIS